MPINIKSKFIDPEMTADTELAAVESALQGQIDTLSNNSPFPNMIFVNSKSDFPAAVSGVITLAANVTYFITTTVDLTGDRLVGSQNTTLIGGSSENCFLISTGLSASTALISSAWSIPMRSLSITHGTALNLDATGNANQAIDWFGVNFTSFDGTMGTVGFDQCLFSGIAGQTTLNFPSTLTITRRIRVIYSSFVAFGGATAINVDVNAVIPVESYILITVNFSGGATYVAGVQHDDNKALFQNCKGISNTAEVGQMYFNDNATQNAIATQSVFEKIEGTTTASAENEKFSHTSNRLTYTGGITREFVVTASCAAQSIQTNATTITIRIAKNGTTIAESEAKATTSATGRSENFYCQALVQLAQNDFIELFIANETNANNLLVTDLNVLTRSAE
jgi:hypothetical protein